MHVNEMSKIVGEKGQLQSLVEKFIRQASRWWAHINPCYFYFIEIFGGKKLTEKTNINKFLLGNDPQEYINNSELEWKRIGYRDERFWPHIFSLTLNDLLNKWYKIEEARGDTFPW